MTGGFADPVVNAIGELIKQQIRSPNYIPGVSGWTIDKDGSAEFNNLVIRGTFFGTDFIIGANGIFFYSGVPTTGNLLMSWARTAGNDSFGNSYPQGLSINESSEGQASVVMGYTSGSPLIYFPDDIVNIRNSAGILGTPFGAGNAQQDAATFLGPQDNTYTDTGALQLVASSRDGTQGASANLIYTDRSGVEHLAIIVNGSGVAINEQISQAFTADTSPLILQSNTASSANGFIKQIHAVAASLSLRAFVTGDTNDRFNMNANGTMHWGPGNAAVDTFLQRIAVGVLATTQSMQIGSTNNLNDGGVGVLRLANSTTLPTGNPVGGCVVSVKQGVPTVTDPGGNTLGMVRNYGANSTSNLASFTTETDVPGATVNVVVTGSNATVVITGQFDFNVSTTVGTTMIGFLNWNGVDRPEQAVMVAGAITSRECVSRTWRITGVSAGTYVAKLRASCTNSAVNNVVEFPHTGFSVMVIDQ